MRDFHHTQLANRWVQKIFDAKSARQGQVVRRSMRDIEQIVGRAHFETELKRRGYQAVQNGDQVIVFCNNQPFRFMC